MIEINTQDTALLITDPQNDFLSPEGATWDLVGESVTEMGPSRTSKPSSKQRRKTRFRCSSHPTITTLLITVGSSRAHSRG